MSRLTREARLIFGLWLVLSAIALPLVVLVLGPHLPPGRMSSEAGAQTDANVVLTAVCTPIVILLAVQFGYSLVAFRARPGDLEDGPPIQGHGPTQVVWLVVTSAVVVALAVWGSYTLIVSSHGAGGGQGPNPDAIPKDAAQALQVQVIGQQWNWTYRFPAYRGVETKDLELPTGRAVELHVTSLDVAHSFWAYQLGVKADAIPGVDNIAYVHPRKRGSFMIRCAELCGLWHGHMYQTGHVVTPAQFASWIRGEMKQEALNLRYLPAYSRDYFPEPLRRAG
ncbi:MAG TPA: cytochrome c oxidase subunit II [Gaiellaceae bacterium]|nr:cytochrome c oxidase subunit II [Gaiellaceae bacterium]